MKYAALAALVTLSWGCAPSFPEKPGQTRAGEIVWRHSFGAESAAPLVEWREDRCGDEPRAAVVFDGKCYSGLYLRGERALIAWRGSLSASAFAHELMHAWQWERGIEDPDHARADDWALVDAADAALRNHDL